VAAGRPPNVPTVTREARGRRRHKTPTSLPPDAGYWKTENDGKPAVPARPSLPTRTPAISGPFCRLPTQICGPY
jgi:hypothetical protein